MSRNPVFHLTDTGYLSDGNKRGGKEAGSGFRFTFGQFGQALHAGFFQKLIGGFVKLVKAEGNLIFSDKYARHDSNGVSWRGPTRIIGDMPDWNLFTNGWATFEIIDAKSSETPVVGREFTLAQRQVELGQLKSFVAAVMSAKSAGKENALHFNC